MRQIIENGKVGIVLTEDEIRTLLYGNEKESRVIETLIHVELTKTSKMK